jgi:hypothetical protein
MSFYGSGVIQAQGELFNIKVQLFSYKKNSYLNLDNVHNHYGKSNQHGFFLIK